MPFLPAPHGKGGATLATTMGKKRAAFLLCAAAVALAALVAAGAGRPAGAATDVLPDLRMAKLTNVQIQNRSDGDRWLRFDTVIVNVGAGKFEAHGTRSGTSTPTMAVHQHVFDSAGGFRDRATSAQMYYSGDGHSHWHVRNLERYSLTPLDNNAGARSGNKEGFCFYDNAPFGSATGPYYTGCANGQPGALGVKMGLSRGWGDNYGWNTVGQYINVTGLPDGLYRLRATADTGGWFLESNETNNFTWAEVRIRGTSVSVTKYGPAAQPIG